MSQSPSKTLSYCVAAMILAGASQHAAGQRLLGAKKQSARNSARKSVPPARSASKRQPPASAGASGGKVDMPIAEGLAWQASLERAGYSPGVIDGVAGTKTITALLAFQNSAGIPATGKFDAAARQRLGIDATPSTRRYVLTDSDAKLVGECPEDWRAKSKAKWLGFKSLASVAANVGHCSEKLLAQLNPAVNVATLKPGDEVVVPNVAAASAPVKAASVEVDFAGRLVRALDDSGKTVGLFPCSIAREKRDRPAGPCSVANITMNPRYVFKPESWPEVKGVKERLLIPPGPRNPVGVCWIGLSLRGYGIHGTPEPELIGKTGSHGCIRLTNWHVLRLAEMLEVGATVRFVDDSQLASRRG